MSWTVVAQAVRPTARAVAWGPLLGVVTALAVITLLARLLADGAGTGPLPMLTVALLAAVSLVGMHDPAHRLLAAVPVGSFARRMLRIALVLVPATVALIALGELLPGRPEPLLAPGLALLLAGLAVATWTPPDRGLHVAATVPVLWVSLHAIAGPVLGVTAGPLAWWQTHPFVVAGVAACAVVLGGRR